MIDYSMSQFLFDKEDGYYRIRTRILAFVAELTLLGNSQLIHIEYSHPTLNCI
jgi:hypothetical protein